MRSPTRVLVGVVGVVVAAYGVLRLLELGAANLRGTVTWLVGGVVLHDAVFAPVVIAVSVGAARVLPRRMLAPATVVLVVLVPVTLLAVPELGRFGADSRNPTLLDRHYWLGWSALATLVGLSVVTAAVVQETLHRRRAEAGSRGGDDGAGDGDR